MLRLLGSGFVTTPDTAGLSVTGDIDLRALIQSDVLPPSSDQGIIAKWSAGQKSYSFYLNSVGGLGFDYSATGTAVVSADSNATVASAALYAGDAYHVRVTHDVDNGFGSRDTKFYTSIDGSTWTQLGDTITAGPVGAGIFDGAAAVQIGRQSIDGFQFIGSIFSAEIRDGINGTVKASPTFHDPAQGWVIGDDSGDSGVDSQGNTWTISGLAAAIVGVQNMHGAMIVLEMGFGFDPISTPVWTVVTDDLRGWTCRRGRQYELDRMEAGTATARLNNRHGNYNPKNTAGLYTPNVRPQLPIRIRALFGAEMFPIWRGAVDRFPFSFPEIKDAVVEISASDVMEILARRKAPAAFEVAVLDRAPRAYWRLTDLVDSSDEGDHTLTLVGSPDTGEAGVWAGDTAMQFDGSTQYANAADGAADLNIVGDLTIVAWINVDGDGARGNMIVRNDIGATPSSTTYNFSISAAGRLTYFHKSGGVTSLVQFITFVPTDVWVFVAIVRSGSDLTLYIDGAQVGPTKSSVSDPQPLSNLTHIAATDNPGPGSNFDGHISEVAIWDRALNAADITALFEAQSTESTSQRTDERISEILTLAGVTAFDMEAGQTVMAQRGTIAGSVLDEIGKATNTESGYIFVAANGRLKFHDRHFRIIEKLSSIATFGLVDNKYKDLIAGEDVVNVRNDIRVTPGDAANPYVATDTASQAAFGVRTHEVRTYPLDVNEAADLANHLLARYAQPDVRIDRIRFDLGDNAALIPIVLSAEIGDRFTVKKVLEGDDLEQDLYLESIAHRFGADKKWRVTWQLSPATQEQFIILDDPILGTLDGPGVLSY